MQTGGIAPIEAWGSVNSTNSAENSASSTIGRTGDNAREIGLTLQAEMTRHILQWQCDCGGQHGGESDFLEQHGFLERDVWAALGRVILVLCCVSRERCRLAGWV